MLFSAKWLSVVAALTLLLNNAIRLSTLAQQDMGIYHHEVTFDDLLPKTVVQWSLANSKIQCGRLCQAEKWCNSFFYSHGKTSCALQRMAYVSLWSNQTVNAPGWRYYRLTSAHCSHGYAIDRFTATCYRLVTSPMLSWLDARAACNSSNGRLVVLEPVEKARFLLDYLNTNKALYNFTKGVQIGASRPESEWDTPLPAANPNYVWVNGQPLDLNATQAFWVPDAHSGDPLDNVVTLRKRSNYLWVERPQRSKRLYVCERVYN